MATTNSVNGHAVTAHVSVEEFLKTDFDYLVCGGGTAGLVVAARLSENPDVNVGVIEAGKNKLGDPVIDIPMLFSQALNNPEYDWGYYSVPQKGNKDTVHNIVRGKALGGSSAINYTMYVRGSLQDYDDWAELAQDESWSSSNMMRYMRKHETMEPIDARVVDRTAMPFVGEHHGTSGPIRTSFNDSGLAIDVDVLKAAGEATGNTKKPVDPWSGDHIGFYNNLNSISRTGPNRGKRSYAATAYFEENQHRPNLKLITESMVAKVVLENGSAKGVEFITGGQKHVVKARREVLLAGGALNSPQILELSGIGDPEVLKAAGVECLVNLPSIGNDLQDHLMTWITTKLTEGHISAESVYQPEVMAAVQKEYAETRGGPMTSISTVQGFFPAKSFLEQGEVDRIIQSITDIEDGSDFHRKQRRHIIEHVKSDKSANLQFILVPIIASNEGIKDQSKLFLPPGPGEPNGITIACSLNYPVARGHVHIKSSDPFEPPEIDPAYLGHVADVVMLAAGLKFLDKLLHTDAMKGKVGKRVWPKPEVDLSDRNQRIESVREAVMSTYHHCGSVAMGHSLDSRLRVKGVQNLRVVDASAFPNHISGNIQSSVYAMAEKASDMIKEDNDYSTLKKVAS